MYFFDSSINIIRSYSNFMMGKKLFLFFIFIYSFSLSSFSQNTEYKFRVMLKDKGVTSYSIDNPIEYLSQRAIDRRTRQNIAIDDSDIPISDQYISDIIALNCEIVAQSKWLKSVSVNCADSATANLIKQLPYVDDVIFVWKGTRSSQKKSLSPKSELKRQQSNAAYGRAYTQISLNNGHQLHQAGYKGTGMHIAVIDAGFTNVPSLSKLSNVNIIGYKDFVFENENNAIFSSSQHGTMVLSTIATNQPDEYIGTAPDASYWLLRSEDINSEYPIEEDYWVAAAEFADSVGVDLINTSLGYNTFDAPSKNYTHSDLDGKTAYISKGAEYAVQKGIFVVASAGNERNGSWKKIVTPSDAENVLSVGAIGSDSIYTYFSSYGPSADYRIKPDVMAMGLSCEVVNSSDNYTTSSGTSYSAPILCGMIACLWQAYPDLTNLELLDIVRKSGNKYDNPDANYGYGIPDMTKAVSLANIQSGIGKVTLNKKESLFTITSDKNGYLRIEENNPSGQIYQITVYNSVGQEIYSGSFSERKNIQLKYNNVYLIHIKNKNVTENFKIFTR